jgi:hypothetical protein
MLSVAATRLPWRSMMEKWVVCEPPGTLGGTGGSSVLGVARSGRIIARRLLACDSLSKRVTGTGVKSGSPKYRTRSRYAWRIASMIRCTRCGSES